MFFLQLPNSEKWKSIISSELYYLIWYTSLNSTGGTVNNRLSSKSSPLRIDPFRILQLTIDLLKIDHREKSIIAIYKYLYIKWVRHTWWRSNREDSIIPSRFLCVTIILWVADKFSYYSVCVGNTLSMAKKIIIKYFDDAAAT